MKGEGDVYTFLKNNFDKIIDHLKDEKPNLRKTKMAVLVSLFPKEVDTSKLRAIMLEDANKYNEELRSQKMNDKQKENWLTMEEIKDVYKRVYRKALPSMKKDTLTKSEYQDIYDFVLLSLYTLIPPRRSQDFSEMKIRNYDPEVDNYFDGKHLVFKKYKTAKNYGTQTIKPTPRLKNILLKWKEINKHDYLLSSYAGHKASVSRITLLLNRIFGKNVSTTLLRHIYISSKVLPNTPTINEREQIAASMGHSIKEQELYKKID
jgi:hypothetical protein